MNFLTNNAEHYKWGNNCDGWHLLKSDTLSVIKEKMPPGTAEKLHYHLKAQQVFYILSGVACFIIEDYEFLVYANESIHIAAQKKHLIKNDGEEDLVFIVISEPKSHGDRYDVEV